MAAITNPGNSSPVAFSPNAPGRVPGLLKLIASSGQAFLSSDPEARLELLEAVRSLFHALETPREAMVRYCWCQSTTFACLETAMDLGLFKVLCKDDKPKNASELSEAVNCDTALVARLLRHLSACGVIHETGADEYRRTGLSTSLSLEPYSDCYSCMTSCLTKGILALPAHLKKTDYRSPSNGIDCSFQLGFQTPRPFFDFLGVHPDAMKQFHSHMSVYRLGRPSWMDVGPYDVPSSLLEGTETGDESVLLIDIGGSTGHDLVEFSHRWPQAPGRLILQEKPEVVARVDTASLDLSIEVMEHDFFTVQPVHGARAYYLHSVLHNWTDEDCRRILRNLVPALKRGYSKILISEMVIPETDAYWEATSLDIIMMATFASMERSAVDWRDLVESAGLKIHKIWTIQRGVESLIECELA